MTTLLRKRQKGSNCMVVIVKTGRLIRAVKDVSAHQMYARARLRLGRFLRGKLGSTISSFEVLPQEVVKVFSETAAPPARQGFVERATSVASGRYEFLGRVVQFEDRIDWEPAGESDLWRYNLNYCSVVLDSAWSYKVTRDKKFLNCMVTHIQEWIGANVSQVGVPWSPYTASLRVVNWLAAVSITWDEVAEDMQFMNVFSSSIFTHMEFIRKNLEFDVRGNHLLENIKALIVGGLFLGPRSQGEMGLRLGERLLVQELGSQILADGSHCERSTMYHCVTLEDLLTILGAYQSTGENPPGKLVPVIRSMLKFLSYIRMPNGNIPLLNDSAYGITLSPTEVLKWASELVEDSSEDSGCPTVEEGSGYIRLTTADGVVVVLDCGEVSPRHQPGHAHADTLSFVYSLSDGTDVIIDPGVYEYASGPWRDYFRGTSAHNTVQVDHENSTEVWGSFRAGRKAHILTSRLEVGHGVTHAFGSHNGYRFLRGRPIHRRDLYALLDGDILVIDSIAGSGTHLLESRLHFHPDWQLSRQSNEIVVSSKGRELHVDYLTEGIVDLSFGRESPISGWYAPRFGVKQPCICACWSARVELPYRTGFILSKSANSSKARMQTNEGLLVLSLLNGHTHAIGLGHTGAFADLPDISGDGAI